MKVLVLAAHPDDEVLGCGGTIARLAEGGHDVAVAVLSGGGSSRFGSPDEAERSMRTRLRANCEKAADLLGARKLWIEDLPDNRFDSLDLLDVVKVVENLLGRFSPEALYTHHGSDLNIDHCVTFRAALTAARPMRGTSIKAFHQFEVPSSTEWSFGRFAPPFEPNTFLDISSTLEKKLLAMETYETESRAFPHPRSREAIAALARTRGAAVGLPAAEAFVATYVIG